MKRSLADALVLDHPDVPWSPPDDLPSEADLKRAVAHFEALLVPAPDEHAGYCIAKLLAVFGEKRSREETTALTDIWLDTCAGLPADLWTTATMELLKAWDMSDHYGRAPKPSDLLKIVGPTIARRKTSSDRVKAMLAKKCGGNDPTTGKFVPEPEEQRLRHIIRRAREDRERGGSFISKVLWPAAINAEIRLAEIEQREPEPWANESFVVTVDRANVPKLPPPSPKQQADLARALARHWRATGMSQIAAQREAEAQRLDPIPPDVASKRDIDDEFFSTTEHDHDDIDTFAR